MKLDTRGRFGSRSFCLSEGFLKGDDEEEELEGTGLEDVGVGLRWSGLLVDSSLLSLAAEASGDDRRYSLLMLMGL